MKIEDLFKKLRKIYGKHVDWWPKYSDNHVFEIAVGAILTQQTRWENVEKVIKKMIELGILNPEKILSIEKKKLEKIIKPCGFPSVKAKRLKNFSSLVIKDLRGNLKNLSKLKVDEARKLLLKINGIGKETADDILLYAGDMKTIPVDYYTKRFFKRIGITDASGYETIRKMILDEINSINDLKEFHALIVEHSKRVCRQGPLCEKCGLKKFCKHYQLNRKSKKVYT